jgi:hypothetical protein
MPLSRRPRRVLAVALLPLFAACTDRAQPAPVAAAPTTPGWNGQLARSMGLWTPSRFDTCTQAQHDAWAVTGPDGRRYPTWHPPVDPATGCTYGHEHGADPRRSHLYEESGGMPFGYVNEVLADHRPGSARPEDHVGHKVEFVNDVELKTEGGGPSGVTCDFLVKLHQGTHSRDAFTNNLHELFYHVRCSDGTVIHWRNLTPIGRPGHVVPASTNTQLVFAGSPLPADSPNEQGGIGRRVPDAPRVLTGSLGENWFTHNFFALPGGGRVFFDPYFDIFDPSRHFDAEAPTLMARPIDVCLRAESPMRHARCDSVRALGAPVPWDDPRSPFRGTIRNVHVNSMHLVNANGRDSVWTDVHGFNAAERPFPGSVLQRVARIDNRHAERRIRNSVLDRGFGTELRRDYHARGVHAPN